MFNLKELKKAMDQIAEEKGLDPKKVLEAMENSIAAAYKKEYCNRGDVVKAKLNLKTGNLNFWKVQTVVDDTTIRIVEETEEEKAEKVDFKRVRGIKGKKEEKEVGENGEELLPRYNPDRHIFLDEAKKIKKDVKVGDELTFDLETHDDFGRIAAQTAKQVILQRLREAERSSILEEYKDKVGTIISGVVQRFDRGNVFIDLGRVTGIMFYNESIPGEHYSAGTRMRFYVSAVQEESRTPGIILSRSHPEFVRQLFELEVPEIADDIVEIKEVSREAGSRTKIAVSSTADGIDPVGSCVGQRGTRVMAVSNELGQEKIDIIEWSKDDKEFISASLSPAKVSRVETSDRREAKVFVPEDQLSLAIGKGGQNVRLAAKLTGWKIDVRSQSNPDEVIVGGVADTAEETEENTTKTKEDKKSDPDKDSSKETKKSEESNSSK